MKKLLTAFFAILLTGCANLHHDAFLNELPGEEKRDSELGRKIIEEFEASMSLDEPYKLGLESLVQDGVLVMVQLTHTTMPTGTLLVLVDSNMIPPSPNDFLISGTPSRS